MGHDDGPRQAMVMNGVEAVDMIGVEVAEDDHRHLGNVEVIQTTTQSVRIWPSIDDDSLMWASTHQSRAALTDVTDRHLPLSRPAWEGRTHDYRCYDC